LVKVIQSHREKYFAAHPEEAHGTAVEKHWYIDLSSWPTTTNNINNNQQQQPTAFDINFNGSLFSSLNLIPVQFFPTLIVSWKRLCKDHHQES